ncbi:MAG TPA: alpha/beta fold hydrolase [Solirubrobacteraceae bacterium]|jgi:pimeloyl-ACP methyl ester carboxylesterase|nr:alpha/beta fold hydrolase [Solirubrobacteraceae bacterium]
MPTQLDDAASPRMTLGSRDGIAYVLVAPDAAPRGGVVILHGAGSRKENHLDFARLCAAAGLAAVAFDQRGHGHSVGLLGAGVLDDVAAMAALLGPGPVFLRGSSMGGFVALAAAQRVAARAVVAICPAGPAQLLAGLRARRLQFEADEPALERMLAAVDLPAAAAALGPDFMLLHAEGDVRVPVEQSAALHAHARGSSFVRVPGGDHHSVQHDHALQARALDFLLARTA